MSLEIFSTLPQFSYLSPKLKPYSLPGKGNFGVAARQSLQAGELVAVWSGIVVDGQRLAQLPLIFQQHSLQVEEDQYLVSIRPDEPADYINHSCEPNVGLNGQLTLVAMRDIAVGEEICFDYAMSDGSPYDEFDCSCGSSLCRGHVTGEDWRRPELWERYAGYFSPYLQRRIDRLRRGDAARVNGRVTAVAHVNNRASAYYSPG